MYWSDDLRDWRNYITDVRPEGGNVKITYIRIALANLHCPDLVSVKAIETHVANTDIRKLTGHVDLCSLKEKNVDSALAHTKTEGDISDSSQFGIVAQCGQTERLFHLPFPADVKMETLKARDPQIAALYDLAWDVAKQAFGERTDFANLPPEEDLQRRRLGATLVPQLRAGWYDLGFGTPEARQDCGGKIHCDLGFMRKDLANYVEADVKISKPIGALLDREKYPLTKYEPAEYPPLAIMARIQGRVTLELTVNPASGDVTQAHGTAGHPLLVKAAEEAASQWKFQPSGPEPTRKVTAVLDFSLACREVPGK